MILVYYHTQWQKENKTNKNNVDTHTQKQQNKTQKTPREKTKTQKNPKSHSENFRQMSFCKDMEERKRLTEEKREEGSYSEKDTVWFWTVSEEQTQKPSTQGVPMHFPPQLIRN